MKRINFKNYKISVPALLLLVAFSMACGKKWLNVNLIGPTTPAVLGTKAGVQGLLIGAYAAVIGEGTNNAGWGSAADNWVYGEVCADDAYKGSTTLDQGDIVPLMQFTEIPTNSYLGNKWAAMYDGAQRANDVIRTMRTATGLAPADTTEFKAEALFLRAFFHFELRKMFHYPPYVDETITYNNGNYDVPNIDGSGNYVEIWPKIEADLNYAIANLPATQPNKGQVNKSAAQAYLAKVLLYEGNYDGAKAIFDQLITSGVTAHGDAYGLQANYQNNFNPDPSAKNTAESIFAAQMSVNDGSGSSGGGKAYGDVLNFPYGAGPGACCGFFTPSQDVANAYKTDAGGLPYLDGSWQNHPWVSDPDAAAWTGNVDPRLDWAVGRKGLPYLDWGPMPGDSWIRSPSDDGHFVPKKNVYAKSVQGTLSDNENNWANVELDANNVNLMRFSDMLLMAAECDVLGSSQDLATAEKYVNMVRTRAGSPGGMVLDSTVSHGTVAFSATTYTYATGAGISGADKYVVNPYPAGYFTDGPTAMKAIIMERRIELAEEGHRYFDLARWQGGNPVYPAAGYMTTVLNAYATQEAVIHPAQYQGVSFTTGKNEYFPIPQQQLDAENSTGKIVLKQIPNY
jgi:starch-binding outer membrane protein, SusD/RagB family